MKRIVSIGLILLMSLQCIYKLGVITYFQLNRDYIAEVLCVNKEKPITMCYGQCFLDDRLEIAQDQSSDEGTVPVGKQRVDFPIFIISENHYSIAASLRSQLLLPHYLAHASSEHSSPPFHPPAVPA